MTLHHGAKTRYYKYTYESWTQPTLSANGSMGGSSFACTGSAETNSNGDRKFFHAFDNNSDTYWRNNSGSGYITFYNPKPLKVTNIKWSYFYSHPTGGNVQGSDNNSTWTTIVTWTNSTAGDFNIKLNSNTKYYKYYKINITGVNNDVIHCKGLTITAEERTGSVESTEDDYDYSVFNDGSIKQIYKGSTAMALAYKGSTLIWSIYPVNGTVFEKSAAGTYTFTPLASGAYEISLVGPGSGGACAGDQSKYASKSRGAGGGSGAYVCGVWNLVGGTAYTIVVGAGGPAGPTNSNNGYSNAAGDSSFGSFIVCGGGGGATAVWKGSAIGGAAGTVKTCTGYKRLITSTAGNQGAAGGDYTLYAGGAAKLGSYGAGGSGQATGNYAGVTKPGNAGYCKIRFLVE
jgi:hypothetical protein